MENKSDDAECTRPPVVGDLVDLCRELNQRNREKDAVDRSFLRRLLEDRGEWPVL